MNVFETDVVIGVREENDNFYQHSGHGLQLIKESTELRLEREDIFREVGSMRLIKREILNKKEILNKIPITKSLKVGHVNLDERSSIRISSNFMWELVKYLVEKASISINGVSLTISKIYQNSFEITVIPHTLKLTNLKDLKVNDSVNVELDIFGKYVHKHFK